MDLFGFWFGSPLPDYGVASYTDAVRGVKDNARRFRIT